MTFNKMFTFLLLCASAMLVYGSVVGRPEDSQLVRRNYLECAKEKVNDMWQKKPDFAYAAICNSGDNPNRQVANNDGRHYKRIKDLDCKQRSSYMIFFHKTYTRTTYVDPRIQI
ncbi:uncharacterized protein MEPE_03412 [Melanopsichium pennsylvanicum]|uniref:Secreted protein n=1 Tax=Melanopsichium pennsylvanicum TaxID=63383 RepID=A0AAJ5C5L9_9BASI|nr:uncharacterized protein MEPE_03412 [Melanopsichium pennsylvanicum]